MVKFISFVIIIGAIIAIVYAIGFRKNKPANPKISKTTQIETIVIENNRFIPTALKIPLGATVVFENKDTSYHQVASDPHPTHTAYPQLNLPILAPGETSEVIFTKQGTFGLHDHLLPTLKAQVVVE